VHPNYCGQEEISVDALIEEQRRLARSTTFFEKVVGTLCLASLLKQRLAALTDAAVGQLMVDHVWSELNLLGPESVIVEVASERLLHSSPVLVKSVKENITR
jgi:hypothetical protein